jgi:two-component system, LuxR family, response regulator FixJ
MTSAKNAVVFVVEDDLAARRSLVALVRSRGLKCQEYASAEDFLGAADASTQGAVITDLRMGGMSGLDLQDALGKKGSLLPVIVVSGHADVPITVKLMENGAVTLLQKPYEERALLEAIDKALQKNLQARTVAERIQFVERALASLSSVENRTLKFMLEGQQNKTIARETATSLRTVDRRRRSVLNKMHVGSIAELVQMVAEYEHAKNVDKSHPPQEAKGTSDGS